MADADAMPAWLPAVRPCPRGACCSAFTRACLRRPSYPRPGAALLCLAAPGVRVDAAGKDDVCSTRRQYTVHNTWGYSAAYFSVYGDGDLPDGSPLPDGMRPDASCVVKPPRRSCTLRFHHTPDMQWEISSRDIWTQVGALSGRRPRLVRWQPSARNPACAAGQAAGAGAAACSVPPRLDGLPPLPLSACRRTLASSSG